MKFNVHAGHNPAKMVACGAVGIVDESIEDRKIKDKVIYYLQRAGHTVYDCTCNNGVSQRDVLEKIVKKCNAHNVALDVSIHLNCGVGDFKGNGVNTGTEVLVYSENSKAVKPAKNICAEIEKLGYKNRGVKVRNELMVLNSTKSEALLIETFFCDDADDVKLYKTKTMAQAITVGILNSYTSFKYKVAKKVALYTPNGKKTKKTMGKGSLLEINKFAFKKIGKSTYFMGRIKGTNRWVKIKHLTLI